MSEPVCFETLSSTGGRQLAIATLSVPATLNALTLEMVERLDRQLRDWAVDPAVACVVIRGAGDRALCSGGDVVRLRESGLVGDDYAARFFEREYRLDYLIHTYAKPVMVWGHGVVMGGGLGILCGGSQRVVTESTRMAMPEVTIGLYPDVGGTFFLNRTPGRTGLFLALTGAAINAADALYLGLADRFIEHAHYDAVIAALCAASWSGDHGHDEGLLRCVLRDFGQRSAAACPHSPVREHRDWIDQVTDGDDLAQVVAQITAYDGDDPWLQKAARTLASGCPTTIRLIDEQLRRGRYLSLREAFQLELILSINCVQRVNFAEGVRALLVDKDRSPAFSPDHLAAVSDAWVEAHFQPPWGDAPHPLADL